jgi:serine/threonine protein phosphatase PrpC
VWQYQDIARIVHVQLVAPSLLLRDINWLLLLLLCASLPVGCCLQTHTGGEDAYFISTAGHGAIGVSDGVSAWAEDGIDPGEYSRTLVQYCSEAIEERAISAARAANKGAFVAKFDPRSVLRFAQQCTCKPGSATVVLAALQPQGKLHVANLGDCGVKVVRDGKVLFETQPQQHDFNLPYQLSHPRLFPDTDTADSADRWVMAD